MQKKPITDQGLGVQTKGQTITDQGTWCTDQGTVDYLQTTAPTSQWCLTITEPKVEIER